MKNVSSEKETAERAAAGQPRTLREIALEVRKCWQDPYFGAKPYIEAMLSLTSIKQNYGADSAKDVVIYFLANARNWRGEDARRIKAELKRMAGVK